jgi:hypothetical protein
MVDEEDLMSLIDAERSRLKGEIRVLTRERDAVRKETLLFIADDLRRVAEAHFKSAGIEGRRLHRKHLNAIGNVVLERAVYYEKVAAGEATL